MVRVVVVRAAAAAAEARASEQKQLVVVVLRLVQAEVCALQVANCKQYAVHGWQVVRDWPREAPIRTCTIMTCKCN